MVGANSDFVLQDRDMAAAGLECAEKAVHAAQCELAGAEAGDGRDESNRSMQERLADLRNEQVCRRNAREWHKQFAEGFCGGCSIWWTFGCSSTTAVVATASVCLILQHKLHLIESHLHLSWSQCIY